MTSAEHTVVQTATQSAQSGVLKIAAVQFFFMMTWVIYGIYLGDLLVAAGLDKTWLAPIFLFDQLIFVVMDPLMGVWADRIEAQTRRLAPLIIGLNLIAAIAFVTLPLLTTYLPGVPTLLLLATLIWTISASVLRAPLFVLLDRLPGAPDQTSRVAFAAAGMAIGAAVAPFIGLLLKGVSPLLPFLLSSVALAVAGLSLPSIPARVVATRSQHVEGPIRPISWLFGLTLLLACGFQFHAFVASAALYRQFVSIEDLPWFLPMFWIGFNLSLIPATRYIRRYGALIVLRYVVSIGSAALLLCLNASNLPVLIVGQCILGACWGGFFLTGLRVASTWHTPIGNGLALGGWFSMLSLAAAGRISLDKFLKMDGLLLETIAVVLWAVAAIVAWKLFARGEKHVIT